MNPVSIALTVTFLLFFALQYLSYKHHVTALSPGTISSPGLRAFNVKHTIGILILAPAVVLLFKKGKYFYQLPATFSMPGVLLTALVIIVAGVAFNASKKNTDRFSRHGIAADFSLSIAILFVIIRCCFLIIYECYFRGLLLTTTAAFTSTGIAILINLLLYTGVHAFAKRNEIFACIPFGLLVCILTLYGHSILMAILPHITFAVVYEGNVLRIQLLSSKKLSS